MFVVKIKLEIQDTLIPSLHDMGVIWFSVSQFLTYKIELKILPSFFKGTAF